MLRLAVLASTNATDLDAIHRAISTGMIDATITVVICNTSCGAVDKAKKLGIPVHLLESKGTSKEEYDLLLKKTLEPYAVDLLLLIGYMKIITPILLDAYPNKIINVHPSLLPEFAGGMDQDVHQQVLDAGVKKTGATLHFVDESVDGGPIIMQKEVQVDPGESVASLKTKVQKAEQELFVNVLQLYSKGKIHVQDSKVIIDG